MRQLYKDITCIILAAGKGKRMKSDVPKVLHNISGLPIISYVINAVRKAGINKIIVVAGFKAQVLKDRIPDEIEVVIQEKLLGTADALKVVKKRVKNLSSNVLVIYADIPLITSSTLRNLIKKHILGKNKLTLVTERLENPTGYGRIVRDKNNNIIKIIEEEELTKQDNFNEVNAGIYCFNTNALFKVLPKIKPSHKSGEFYLTDIIYLFNIKNFKIDSINPKSFNEVIGVNTRKDLAYVEKIMEENIIDKFMKQGVIFLNPDTIYIQNGSKIGRDTIILPNTYIEKNVVIGKNCTIGPASRIREGSLISDRVEIGNFSEIVRSKIGTGTKIKHFSYIGDAKIGENVNIGAGTIIANYDGVKKNKTIIENNAFIGSGTILIAPVKVCRNAITGAGSVVTKGKNVPAGSIVVGVPARVLKSNEARTYGAKRT